MGILDDAIRQHLELKRQHGAPEEEVQRQEEEALGPARRDVTPAEQPAGELDGVAEAPDAADAETELYEGDADEPAAAGAEAELYERDAEEPAAAGAEAELYERDTGPEEPATASEPDLFEPGEPEPEGVPEPEPEGVPEPEELPPSPAPFDAESAFEEFGEQDEPAAGDDEQDDEPGRDEPDVLEDTPDFLQETPEHDRLWFEQKPPRDFDFD